MTGAMVRRVLSCCAAVILVAAAGLCAATFSLNKEKHSPDAVNELPKNSILEIARVHDLGLVPIGSMKEARISMRNLTDDVIRVQVVSSSCSCILANLKEEEIPPRGEGMLVAVVNVSGTNPKIGSEVSLVATRLQTNSAVNGAVSENAVIRVLGRIEPTQGLVPDRIQFGEIVRNTGIQSRMFRIRAIQNTSPELLSKLEFGNLPEFIKVQLQSPIENKNGTWDLFGELCVDTEVLPDSNGPLSRRLTVELPIDNGSEKFQMMVEGMVHAQIESKPSIVYIGQSASKATEQLQLLAHSGVEVSVDSIETDIKGLTWSSGPGLEVGRVTIDFSGIEPSESLVRGRLLIRASCGPGKSHLVKIPVIINR